ncbi:hypothetical protein [Labrenzia sp. 011]|uniref:hypothetical protein n=1 Tax=Labrenzia sp. 011 TaxID=2171494 RepID=UPI000D522BB4|nr:hypothetical protein [Labrenzia sp. 011]PVB62195.1 hypothetical protein DCO57_07790 [Labrenzia sp. 011]
MLSLCDEGPDLMLFCEYLMALNGADEYGLHVNWTDEQRNSAKARYDLFGTWYADWIREGGVIAECM